MKTFKAKYTERVLDLAGKFPFLFSRRLRFLGEDYKKPASPILKEILDKEDNIKSASLFSGEIRWKGVSLVTAVDRDQLKKILKWMGSQKGSIGNYHDGHAKNLNSTDLAGSGTNNLGVISFDHPFLTAVGNISITARLPQGCYVTTARLKKGVTYLSLYISLSESTGDKIFDVDVRDIERYKCFESLNPLSPHFSVVVHHDRRNLMEEKIYGNARSVMSEVHQAIAAVLQVWGVKKEISDFSTVADFCREGVTPYFVEASEYAPPEESSCFTVIEPWRGKFMLTPISDDPSEEYIEGYFAEKIGVNAIFLKREDSSLVEEHNRYAHKMLDATDCYTYILNIHEVCIQFKKCMETASSVFLSYKKNSRENLRILIQSSLSLNLLEERLTAIEQGLHLSERKYHNFSRNRIFGVRSLISDLKSDLERRRDLNNGELQLTNLIWTKRYSVLIFILVLIQITLSVINVDWSDAGREKNPMYINVYQGGKKVVDWLFSDK